MQKAIQSGWWSQARQVRSPNYNQRPNPNDISLLVIHNISLPPGEFGGGYIEQFFCNQLKSDEHPYFASICDTQVSSHCLISRFGDVTQFVSFKERAWHAGRSCFQGRHECNDFSIGIELEGTDEEPYTHEQYRSLMALTQDLMLQYPAITTERIVGHSDISPDRKTDPGSAFDWSYYRQLLNRYNL